MYRDVLARQHCHVTGQHVPRVIDSQRIIQMYVDPQRPAHVAIQTRALVAFPVANSSLLNVSTKDKFRPFLVATETTHFDVTTRMCNSYGVACSIYQLPRSIFHACWRRVVSSHNVRTTSGAIRPDIRRFHHTRFVYQTTIMSRSKQRIRSQPLGQRTSPVTASVQRRAVAQARLLFIRTASS